MKLLKIISEKWSSNSLAEWLGSDTFKGQMYSDSARQTVALNTIS